MELISDLERTRDETLKYFSLPADDLARICHAHPTLSEAIPDAAMAGDTRALQKAN